MFAKLRNRLTGGTAAQDAAETYAFTAGCIHGATVALDANGRVLGAAALAYVATVRDGRRYGSREMTQVAAAFIDGCQLVIRKRLYGARL